MRNLSAPHSEGVMELKDEYVSVMHGPTERKQRAM